VRQHGAQEEEAAKASELGFDASASCAEFEQAVFSAFSVTRATLGSGRETGFSCFRLPRWNPADSGTIQLG